VPDADEDGDGLTNEIESQLGTDPLDPDTDGDVLIDGSDSCPTIAEDVDGFEDGDGCPDVDNDLDGICDPGQASISCTGSDTGQMAFFPADHGHGAPTFDCRNIDEDYDSFRDNDGCPEPDNDNDGSADADDQCDGTDALAGPDGVLGSAEDADHNGVLDAGEDTAPFNGLLDTDDIVLTYEDTDGVLDNDGCYDFTASDFDGDGYANDVETLHLGTRADRSCGANWPSNLVDTGMSENKFDIVDIGSFIAPLRRYNTNPGDAGFDLRWDLAPGSNFGTQINIQDVGTTATGMRAYPPMFRGAFAFGKTCPFTP
jgi:hypothetical protein